MVKKTGDAKRAGYFSKYDYKSEPYMQAIPYTKTQPPDQRKLGFGSKDAFKTDEFTNTIATEVYRDTLRKEQKMYRKGREKLAQKMAEGGGAATASEMSQLAATMARDELNEEKSSDIDEGAPTLYELCHDPKLETYGLERKRRLFPRNRDRNYGPVRPMSLDVGWGCNDRKTIFSSKATCGGVNRTGEFFDKGHLQMGAFTVRRPQDTIDPTA